MSGIAGVWNLDGKPVDRSLLEKMSQTLVHRGSDGEGIQIQSSMGMACQNFNVMPESLGQLQPLVNSSGVMLVFDGRLDNRGEIFHGLGDDMAVSRAVSDAALILLAYQVHGENLPEKLNGDFALALYDPDRHLLLLIRDSIGVKPLYYYRGNGFFIFASEVKALLAHPGVTSQPEKKALASLLLGGGTGYGGEKGFTFFEGIFSVPPAHFVRQTVDGVYVRRYWDFDPACQLRLASFQEYAEAFRQHFTTAVHRRIRSAFPVAVSVSGGLDSSAIFCQAERLRRSSQDPIQPVLGFSWVYKEGSPADERKFLLAMERELGLEIQKIQGDNGSSSGLLKRLAGYSESPLLIAGQKSTENFYEKIRETGAKTCLTGHWGDQFLFDLAYLIDLFHEFKLTKVIRLLDEYSRWDVNENSDQFKLKYFFRDLLRYHTPENILQIRRVIRGRLTNGMGERKWYTQDLKKLVYANEKKLTYPAGQHISAHFKSFYDMARSSYYVLCMEQSNKIGSSFGLDMAYPFLDRDLIAYLMSIPGEVLGEGGDPKALLRGSMHDVLPRAILERRGKADFTVQGNEGMGKDFDNFFEMLTKGSLAMKYGLVNADVVNEDLSKLKVQLQEARDATLTWSLERLFGLELWLSIFFTP